jgi:hypothetical protein
MNNNLPDDILCYRLKTRRQKQRAIKKDFDKKLLALNKERNQLYKQKYNLGWEDIKPPIIRGFKRVFIVRDDVARSKDSEFFTQLLQKINTKDWSPFKTFTEKKRKFGKKIKVTKPQYLMELQEYEVMKLKLTEKELKYFDVEEKYLFGKRYLTKVWVMNEPWRYVLKVSQNIITKTRIRDVELEQRIAKINNYFEQNNLIGKLDNLLGNRNSNWHDTPKHKAIDAYKNKNLMQVLEIVNEEK